MRRNPPPSTPTPRRFLPAKQRQATTPAPHPQFRSTPRFASSSAPRPTQTRDSVVEDVDDDGEDEQERADLSAAAAAGEGSRPPHTQDSIEVDSEGASTSSGEDGRPPLGESDPGEEVGVGAAEDVADLPGRPTHPLSSPEQRQAKKRRISISPAREESSPLSGLSEHYDDAEAVLQGGPAAADPGDAAPAEARPAQQPVFRPAPRFKPTTGDADAPGLYGTLPAAFSPQRRGARYVPGGLAAELQGWLSEAKGWDGTDAAAGGGDADDVSTLRLVVDQVRPGRHMHLVRGSAGADSAPRGFILAGQGRLTGLGEGASVREGSVVVAGPPVWDVELEGSVWTVACGWRVV